MIDFLWGSPRINRSSGSKSLHQGQEIPKEKERQSFVANKLAFVA